MAVFFIPYIFHLFKISDFFFNVVWAKRTISFRCIFIRLHIIQTPSIKYFMRKDDDGRKKNHFIFKFYTLREYNQCSSVSLPPSSNKKRLKFHLYYFFSFILLDLNAPCVKWMKRSKKKKWYTTALCSRIESFFKSITYKVLIFRL